MSDLAPSPAATKTSAQVITDATALFEAGHYAEAEPMVYQAWLKDRGNPDLLNLRGVMFSGMERYWDAIWCYRDALALNPRGSGIWTNLGNALARLKHFQSAVHCHERALDHAVGPNPLLCHNLGLSFAEAGQHPEAITAFGRALQAAPDHHGARWDRARSYLYLANYRQGWLDYEVRLISGQVPIRPLPGERWQGQPYAGKTLLLLAEQGFGDTIWVARYLSHVKALGGKVIMECQPELVSLIGAMGIIDVMLPRGAPLPDADFHCHLCSLPGIFSPVVAAIPTRPYLKAPPDRAQKLAPLFEPERKLLRVGIVWSGSHTFKRNQDRAQPLMRFLQALAMPGVRIYSLQKGPSEQDMGHLAQNGPIIDLAPHLRDFMDTAAAISHLDLVVMTDSAVAHLAGAMGKPVWLMLGYVAHWLWLLERADSPWYPSIRLFRPKTEGDWTGVFDQASVEMMKLIRL